MSLEVAVRWRSCSGSGAERDYAARGTLVGQEAFRGTADPGPREEQRTGSIAFFLVVFRLVRGGS